MDFPPSHTFIFQTHQDHHHQHENLLSSSPSPSLHSFPSFPSHQPFQGGASNNGASYMMKRSMSFSGIENKKCEELVQGIDEEQFSDEEGYSQIGEKKKRLSMEQVKALEKSFEIGNKLEPERKMQLAKALGLQPRQVAIWFQNRRARWKTKQLEKEYQVLKKQFESLKDDNDSLKALNHKLHQELQTLKGKDCFENGKITLKKENEASWSNGSDNSSNMNLDISRTQIMNNHGSSLKPTSITQLLQSSSRNDLQDESFCNMFHNIDDQQSLWPWPDHQQNHFG